MIIQNILPSIKQKIFKRGRRRLGLAIALILALFNGIIYMAVIPPWQHNDEPNHFEYAWLWANRGSRPKSGDYDKEMRKVVAVSMIDHKFFDKLGYLPDTNSEPAWIGSYSQLNDPPFYYLLASIPLRIDKLIGLGQNIDIQYRSVQLLSLLLYLLTIFFAWGLVGEFAGFDSTLAWIVPVCLALEPSFNGVMTSINDDVGAIAAFTFFLWGAAYLVVRGFSWKGLVWSTLGAVICFITKSNVFLAIPLLLVALFLSLNPIKSRWLLLGLLGAAVVFGIVAIFSWGDAADWYRETFQPGPTRVVSATALVGGSVFQLSSSGNENSSIAVALHQIIPPGTREALSGKTITLGAWIWASQTLTIRGPMVQPNSTDKPIYQNLNISQKPAFYTITIALPADTSLLQVILSPYTRPITPGKVVYYDGLVLLKGGWPADQPPKFNDTQGSSGSWNGVSFNNLLANPSAENAWPRFRRWVDLLGTRLLPDQGRPSVILYAFLKWRDLANYYYSVIVNLVKTFWAKFGWEKVSLLNSGIYRYLGYLMVIGLAGAALALWRARNQVSWRTAIFLSLAGLGMWISTFIMGPLYLIYRFYLPHARYSFPVIALSLLLLVAGWCAWVPGSYRKYMQAIIPAGFFLLDIYAIISIYLYYL
jgi:hypothetical protein